KLRHKAVADKGYISIKANGRESIANFINKFALNGQIIAQRTLQADETELEQLSVMLPGGYKNLVSTTVHTLHLSDQSNENQSHSNNRVRHEVSPNSAAVSISVARSRGNH
ncbi:unnamed protein product, partial [Leptidea sinapis]